MGNVANDVHLGGDNPAGANLIHQFEPHPIHHTKNSKPIVCLLILASGFQLLASSPRNLPTHFGVYL